MAGDKTYITDSQGKQHRATRVHAVTPTDIVWSSNPNDYSVQVKIGGKWHRAILTMDAGASTFFENVNIDKALVVGSDGKNHTALIVKPESTATLSDIKTDEHALVSGTTTGETAVVTYSENWSNVKYQDNVNVYKVLVTGSDGKVHTALLTTSSGGGGGGVEAIVLGTSPLFLPNAIANSMQYVKAFGGTKVGLPNGYTQMKGITNGANTYVNTGIKPAVDDVEIELRVKPTVGSWYIMQSRGSAIWGISGSSSGSTILLGWGGNSSLCQSIITRDATHTYYIKATIKNGVATLYVKDETAGTEDTQPARYTSSLPPLPFWLYGSQNNDRVNSGNTVYMARIKVGGETVMDYAPALNGSNVVGFYDKATGNFVVSSAGTLSTDQPAVITPDTPMDIVSNNGALKVNSQGQLYTDGTVETIEDTIGNTATAEMLLKVGNYQDEQEILSGAVTRKVGIKVLDGTEEYTYSEPNTYGIANITSTIAGKVDGNTILLVCSHFVPQTTAWSGTQTEGVLNGNNNNQVFFRVLGTRIASLAAWQQWLADQYAAGTPVIVLYPLATPTTESVTGQTLQVQSGNNTLEITQASLDDLELEAKYTKVA